MKNKSKFGSREVCFRNKTVSMSQIFERIITLRKNGYIFTGRLLKTDNNNVFRIGTLKTGINKFKQFDLLSCQ